MNHQKGTKEEIIIFTRYPQAGKAKTRLIPELGADGAARLQRSMTEQIIRTAGQLVQESGPRLSVYFAGGSHQLMREWLGPELIYHDQLGGDLGQKMMLAFRDASCRGSKRTVLIGSDCPALTSSLIRDALAALQKSQLVLGPTIDGGYYLIGTTSDLSPTALAQLFTGIAWGTANVFQETTDRASRTGVTTTILKELHDIDDSRDLAYFHHHPDPQ